MTYSLRLLVAPGEGRLARRDGAVLYLPVPVADDEFISLFLASRSEDLDDELASYVLARNLEAPAFVYVSWPDRIEGDRMRAIVRGDATLTSDIQSVPHLSGAGSSTWVEHRVLRNPQSATISGGDAPAPGTNLLAGVVPAGGFELLLDTADEHDPAPRASQNPPPAEASASLSTPTPPQPTETSGPAGAAQPVVELPADPEVTITASDFAAAAPPPDDEPGPVDSTAGVDASHTAADPDAPGSVSGLEALAAASGGDWMEESLQLGSSRRSATPPAPTESPAAEPARSNEPSSDDGNEELHPSSGNPVQAASDTDYDIPNVRDEPQPPSGGPPVFPGDESQSEPISEPGIDTETTIAEDDLRESPSAGRLTSARMCPRHHPNSPHDSVCRACSLPLDLDEATVTVEQPVLARLRLPDGSVVPLSGDVVIGRNPTLVAAKIDNGALVSIAAPTSVSRTHLRLSVDGWQLLATDCSSRAGSAIVEAGEGEPIELEPWMAHELNDGDQIFLGGPTMLIVEDSAG